jgi:Flp pilus assembly protein TadG
VSRLRRTRRRDDRGAVSAIVAALLAGGVLLGMTAIVVDVGQLYAEREELQSGADAAAMAVAVDCATGADECTTGGVRITAADRAADNARDGFADAASVCGEDGTGPLGRCTNTTVDSLVDCLDVVDETGLKYVEVRTSTRTSGNSTLLPPTFAGALVPGYQGSTVGACSRVAWGVPRGGVLGFTISACEWLEATEDGESYAPAPPASVTEADGYERSVIFRDPGGGGGSSCPSGPAGWDAPGLFGWTDDTNGQCRTSVFFAIYRGDTGSDVPSGSNCDDVLRDARTNRTVLAVPIYKTVWRAFGSRWYELHGVAAFVVTGYRLPGLPVARSTIDNDLPCGNGQTCVSGYFVDAVLDWSDDIDSDLPYLGAMAYKTIG